MPVWGLWKMISFTSMRKERILRCWGIILPVALLIYIMLCRFLPGCARGYADYVYPNVSFVLSAVSSVIPVSWEEIMAVVVVSLMIFIPVMARRRGEGWLVIFRRLTLLVLWIIIWFYMAWGVNYFRPSLYARCNLRPVEYEEEVFMKFLDVYTEGLNASFTHDTGIEKEEVETIVKRNYAGLSSCYGLARPQPWQHIKHFGFTPLYSSVGVLGAMGPFFAEAQVNEDVLPEQYPFTMAHEFAHLLGVGSEAEANYFAFLVCMQSDSDAMRYSGYFSLLPYVVVSARKLLSDDRFQEWGKTVRPEIWQDYEVKQEYWSEKYSPLLGGMQDFGYNLFLKGNRVSEGKKNYGRVVELLMAASYNREKGEFEDWGREVSVALP